MEFKSTASGNDPDGLTQYEGTIRGKAVKLSYVEREDDGNRSRALRFSYTYDGNHIVDDHEMEEINNDEIICVVEESQNVFKIKTVSSGTADSQVPSMRKLVTVDATNLPPSFVKDNIISPQFPYLGDASGATAEEDGPHFYVIISTNSGSRQAEDFCSHVVLPLLASGTAAERAHTKIVTVSSSTITEFAQQTLLRNANTGTPQTVLLLSGDGGVVDILNALHFIPQTSSYRPPTIGLVAMGTGNALAHSTGLSRDQTLGLRRFYHGTPRPLPTFTARFSPGSVFLIDEGRATSPLPTALNTEGEGQGIGILHGAVVCSWALHASIVAESDTTESRRHGNARFIHTAQELLRPADGSLTHEYKGRVSYIHAGDTHPQQGNAMEKEMKEFNSSSHIYLLGTLVSHLEPGFHISPASQPLDGQLRLLRLGAPMVVEGVEEVLGRAFTDGSHVDEGRVEYIPVEKIRIEILEKEERWRRVCVDGKIVVVLEGGWVEVEVEVLRNGKGEGEGEGRMVDIVA